MSIRRIIEDAEKALRDPALVPTVYQSIIVNATPQLNAADDCIEQLKNDINLGGNCDDEARAVLDDLETLKAHAGLICNKVDDHWSSWQLFQAERDAANAYLDEVRQPLDNIVKMGLCKLPIADDNMRMLLVRDINYFSQ
jgi:hypothetical protein